MTTAVEQARRVPPGMVAVEIVDSDVHPMPASDDEIRQHLPARFRDVPAQLLTKNSGLYLPPGHAMRLDAGAPDGAPAASDVGFTERQLLGEAGVDIAILLPLARPQKDPTLETALCRATNDWLDATWLSRGHDRFKGSISVCAGDPEGAVREIERLAGHPHFVQVWMNMYSDAPFGDPRYEPIYEAATRHGYPIALHFLKGSGLSLATPVGFSSYYFEHHALYPLTYAAHLISLICNGVFDRFEELKVAFVEGGSAWMLPLLWRFENHWDALRSEYSEVRRSPWDYVRDGVRWTTQPIEEPADRRDLAWTLELMEAERLLMFSSDYPHYDYDDPDDVVRRLPAAARQRILAGNALEFYGLPPVRRDDGKSPRG